MLGRQISGQLEKSIDWVLGAHLAIPAATTVLRGGYKPEAMKQDAAHSPCRGVAPGALTLGDGECR
jgi:hypothetical protein